ncbi:MAG: argininosuccinate synthase [Actinobacteria bacterium]|nr:MAG: argininosuccinate synthase [Actinomycetota bacterium]
MKDKAVLAYSGGLDTSIAINWLQENYNVDVIALLVDVGQPGNLKKAAEKALKAGAVESLIVEAKKDFAENYVASSLIANAVYEGKYPLATALSRPLIGKALAEKAKQSKAKYIAHGCTGKGNDQVRIELAAAAIAPDIKIIAPVRKHKMTRSQAIDYAKEKGIEVEAKKKSPYSIDENLWGRSAECGILEDPWVEPPKAAYAWTVDPQDAPDKHLYINIGFKSGVPISIDEHKLSFDKLIANLNEIGGRFGIGRIDQVENRLVGIKSREIYEAPAATILIAAHRELEALVLEREMLHFKQSLEHKYAQLIYNGQWFSPLKEAMDAFFVQSQCNVEGEVRLKLYKGNATVVGRSSKYSLYDLGLATYEEGDTFDQAKAEGFIELFGMSFKTWARKNK